LCLSDEAETVEMAKKAVMASILRVDMLDDEFESSRRRERIIE